MISAVLIILGLLVTFISEKPKLFKKPVTASNVFIIAVLVGSAAISFTNSISSDYQKARDSAIIDSLNGNTKALKVQISDLQKQSTIAQREYVDSIVNYHNYTTSLLARYGLKVDTLKNAVTKFDTSFRRETPPTLTIFEAPTFDKKGEDRIVKYRLDALNADAHLLEYNYILISIKDSSGFRSLDKPTVSPGVANFTTIVPKGAPYEMFIYVDRMKSVFRLSDTFYLAIDFYYKSKNNVRQTPLRKIYLINCKDMQNEEVASYQFTYIALYLKKHKIWKKSYDL